MASVGNVKMQYNNNDRGRVKSQWRSKKMLWRETVMRWVRRRTAVLRDASDFAAFCDTEFALVKYIITKLAFEGCMYLLGPSRDTRGANEAGKSWTATGKCKSRSRGNGRSTSSIKHRRNERGGEQRDI